MATQVGETTIINGRAATIVRRGFQAHRLYVDVEWWVQELAVGDWDGRYTRLMSIDNELSHIPINKDGEEVHGQ